MKTEIENRSKLVLKVCHVCGIINESEKEAERCTKCKKSFLPLNYFGKVHAQGSPEFRKLFAYGSELHEEDLIKGLYAIW